MKREKCARTNEERKFICAVIVRICSIIKLNHLQTLLKAEPCTKQPLKHEWFQ